MPRAPQQMLRLIGQLLHRQASAQLDLWSRDRLALLTLGIIHAHSAAPARIAAALDELAVTPASVESLERQIRRSENDPQLTAEFCVHPLARTYLQWGQPRELVLALDPTTQDERVELVTIGVCFRGQCLPLVWTDWPAQVPLVGERFWQRIALLIGQVLPLLPPGIPVTWLADRAFGTPAFTDLLGVPGWHYVVRVQQGTIFQDRHRHECPVSALVPTPGYRGKGRGLVFKKRGWRPASVVAMWGPKHKEPLCVVTDLRPRWAVLHLYRRRYSIEAFHRNYKSHGWQWEAGQVTDLTHLERLLVAMAVALWLVVLMGVQVAHELLATPASGRRHTVPWVGKRSLFTLGLARWRRLLRGRGVARLPWRLEGWAAPTWQRQITQHHAWAFIFGPDP